MENRITSETFALPIGVDALAWSFGAITLGMMRDTNPDPLLEQRFEMERDNPLLYQNMLYMSGIREKMGTVEFDVLYETGYATFTAAAECHAVDQNKNGYQFTRDDIYMSFSDLTDERKHPEWKDSITRLGVSCDPLHPLNFTQLLEKSRSDPMTVELMQAVDTNSTRLYKKMVREENEIRKMLEHVAELRIDEREMKSYAYGIMDAWLIHNAHLFLRRAHGMYNPKNPERYEY